MTWKFTTPTGCKLNSEKATSIDRKAHTSSETVRWHR